MHQPIDADEDYLYFFTWLDEDGYMNHKWCIETIPQAYIAQAYFAVK